MQHRPQQPPQPPPRGPQTSASQPGQPPRPPHPSYSALPGQPPRPQPPKPPERSPKPPEQAQAQPKPQKKQPVVQAGPNTDVELLEQRSGVRLSWHLWPTSEAQAKEMGAPFGLLFSPMRSIEGLTCLQREPVRCSHCAGVLNPFANVDVASRRWQCPLCGAVSELPSEIAYASSTPAELQPECATIEYEMPAEGQPSPSAVLLVVDTSVPGDELEKLGETLRDLIAQLPPDTPVGLVTYGSAVEVHELGRAGMSRMWHLGSEDAEMPLRSFQRMLGLLPPTVASFAAAAGVGTAIGTQPQASLQQPPPQYQGQQPPPYGQQPPPYGQPQPPYGGQPQQQQAPTPLTTQQPPPVAASAASMAAAANAARDRFFVRAADVDVDALLAAQREATTLPPPPPPPGVAPVDGAMPPPQMGGHPPQFGMPTMDAFPPQGGAPPNSFTARAAAAVAKEKAAKAAAEAAPSESDGQRAPRCTGSAMAAAVSLMACCAPDGSARAVVFTGGPSVGGKGAIATAALSDTLRSHADIASRGEDKAALRHYRGLARRALARGHALDLVCAALDDTGLWEMRECVQRTGGVALNAETFGAPQLRASLRHLFRKDDDGAPRMGFGGRYELRTTRDCASLELLGSGSGGVGAADADGADGAGDVAVDSSEAAEARCFSWSGGCVGPHTCSALLLKPSADKAKRAAARGAVVLQLCATYKHAAGGKRVMRVSTLQLPCAPPQLAPAQLLPALDQQAAAALVTRLTVQKAEEDGAGAQRWLDEVLIGLMKSLCEYRRGDPRTLVLPPRLAQLPGIFFHLRRSGALRTAGFSPDLTASFRLLASSLNVYNTLVLVQPTLLGYEVNQQPAPLPLDSRMLVPTRSLLLDSFRQIILCHSRQLADALRSGSAPEGVKAMFDAAKADMEALEQERFPAPEVFECEQYGSKARYLTQKLHSDVPLEDFLRALYERVVKP